MRRYPRVWRFEVWRFAVLLLSSAWVAGCQNSDKASATAAASKEETKSAKQQPEQAQEPTEPKTLGSDPPELAQPRRQVEVTPQKVKQGKAVFGTCVGCHGNNAEGRLGMGPRIASESYLAAASDAFLIRTISNGRAGTTMIAWEPSLGEEKIEAVVAYLRSLHPVEPAELDPGAATGDVEHGSKVFRDICSGCHGRHGAGYQETANGTGIGRKAFLDSAPDAFIRYIVKHGKTLTAMKGFGEDAPAAIANLTDQEINDTIAYLRKNAW